MSTVTIDDKENRDPVTGLPLSSLLAHSMKGKKGAVGAPAPQKYIATTITTTVLSPISSASLGSSSSKAQKSGSARVALGVVKRANATPTSALLPTFPSLADADTDDEEQRNSPPKACAPRRSLRIAAANSPARLGSTALTTPTSTSPTSPSRTIKKGRVPKRAAPTSSPTLENVPPSFSASKAKKLAVVKHAGTVIAVAVEAQERVHAQASSERLEEDAADAPTMSLTRVLPAQKKRRTSGRTSRHTSSTTTPGTSPGDVHAFEVFSPLPLSVVDSMTNMTSEGDQITDVGADVDMVMETASPGGAAATAAAVQRIIDQQCKELTVLPLANVSDAYITPSRSVSVSDEGIMS